MGDMLPVLIKEMVPVYRWDCGSACGELHKTEYAAQRCIDNRTIRGGHYIQHANTEWTPEMLGHLRRAKLNGATMKELRAATGLSAQRLYQILKQANRKVWWERKPILAPKTSEQIDAEMYQASAREFRVLGQCGRRELGIWLNLLTTSTPA